jgi:thymidine phosphorylase
VRALGMAVVELGGGRCRTADTIDPRVGLSAVKGIGARVYPGEPLCLVHAASSDAAASVVGRLRDAFTITQIAPAELPAVRERLA